MIKVVLLDIDDTLFSFSGYVRQTMKDGFREFGLAEYDESMYLTFKRINTGLWKQLEQGLLTFEKLLEIRWNSVFKELNIDFDGMEFEKYFRSKLSESAIAEDGAVELLDYLGSKYVLGVASNGPFEQQVNRLRVGQIYDRFKYYFISERVGAQKPSKEFFEYCLREINEGSPQPVAPEEIMIIGDSVSADMAGGRQYGLATCLYRKDSSAAEVVPEADYIVNRLIDIKNIL